LEEEGWRKRKLRKEAGKEKIEKGTSKGRKKRKKAGENESRGES
jgi:hypothetical protein